MSNKSASKIRMQGISVGGENPSLEKLLSPALLDVSKSVDGKIVRIPVHTLRTYHNHPYKVEEDAAMAELRDSIEDFGILTPILVRKMEDGQYEIISGHRRTYAARKIGLTEIPALVLALDDDEADIAMVNANLQRETISTSEKAKALKMKYDAMKHQGSSGGRTLKKMEEDFGESEMTLYRYIKLTDLIDPFMDMLDSGRLGFMSGLYISSLQESEQKLLLSLMEENKCKITKAMAEKLREAAKDEVLDEERILGILSGDTKKRTRKSDSVIRSGKIRSYFEPDATDEYMEMVICSLLDEWVREKENHE